MNLVTMAREFLELPLDVIDAPLLPSRTAMDETLMDELVDSIRAHGLLEPMLVGRVGDRYQVIAGHRRRIACERAGLVAAPCLVYPSVDQATIALQAAENRHREQLSVTDEAIWFAELLEQPCGGDIEKLCGLVGEKLSYVDNRLALFRGDPDVFAALAAGQIKVGVAHELNKWPDKHYRNYYLDCAIRGGATHAVVVGWRAEYDQMFPQQKLTPPAPPTETAIAAGAESNYFTCYVCRKTKDVANMRPVQIHSYCLNAILNELLAAYRNEGPA